MRELTQGAKLHLRTPLGCSIHPHDAFWAPTLCLSQAHTLSWPAHALGLHAHTSGPCPCLSPHSQGSILPPAPSLPHCFCSCASLGSVGISSNSVFFTHPLPPPGAARQGGWKLVGADKANVCITSTMRRPGSTLLCVCPSWLVLSDLKDLLSEVPVYFGHMG